MTWYSVEYPDGGLDIACVNCWSEAQAEAIQAMTSVHSIADQDDLLCSFCGVTS